MRGFELYGKKISAFFSVGTPFIPAKFLNLTL